MAGRYPNRRYEDGESPIQSRSMTQYCTLGKLKTMRDCIGEDAWDELKNSSVGVFLKLVDLQSRSKYIFAATTVHYFLTQQLAVENDHEFWSVIGDQPLRFSLHEYRDITDLRCDPYPEEDASNSVDHEAFWSEMRVPLFGGPTWEELAKVLKRCQGWTLERRMMLGRLCILNVGIYGKHHGSRIPLDGAKRVVDPETFEQFPWGRLGFSCLLDSIKKVRISGDHYSVNGCVHVLLIWVYESVHAIGELYGLRRGLVGVPPLLNWRGSRQRFRFEDLIAEEKSKHGKVRVRHMLLVAPEDRYPQWSDNENNLDPRLDKLIEDIISDQLVPGCWAATNKGPTKKKHVLDAPATKVLVLKQYTRKKRVLDAPEANVSVPKQVSKKQKKQAMPDMEVEISSSRPEGNEFVNNENVNQSLLKVVEALVDEVGSLQKKQEEYDAFREMVKARLEVLELRSERGMRHEVESMPEKHDDEEEFREMVKSKLQVLEQRYERGMGHAKHVEDTVSYSNQKEEKEDDGARTKSLPKLKTPEVPTNKSPATGSARRTPIEIPTLRDESFETPSWMVQPGVGGYDEAKDTVSSSKKKEKKDGARSPKPAKPKTPGVVAKKTPPKGSAKPTLTDDSCETPSWTVQPGVAGSDGLPVTKVVKSAKTVGRNVEAEHQEDKSDEDVVDVTEQQKEEELKMASPSGALNGLDEKRVPKLADTQKSPYIPNSTVKRIIPGVNASGNDYDPMLPVAEETWKRFEEWMQQYA